MTTDTTPTPVTVERLRELLAYDESSGVFRWKKRVASHVPAWSAAGSLRRGYVVIMIDKRHYMAHRLAWLFTTGSWPSKQIDHINGNPGDNRFANLRQVSYTENGQNMHRARIDNRSGLLGAHMTKSNPPRWSSRIKINGVSMFIGTFNSPESAHQAYLEAKLKHHPAQTLVKS